MKTVVTFFTLASALLSLMGLIRPSEAARAFFSWPLKLLAGALAPLLGIISATGALVGLRRRDSKLLAAGLMGAGLAGRQILDVAKARGDFAGAFGANWQERLPGGLRERLMPRRVSLCSPPPLPTIYQFDVPYGTDPATGDDLLADLWQPAVGTPRTGLGLVYVHGGGWRIGNKDEWTRPFFRRLAGQGHVVLDIAYTLWPKAGIPEMVSQVKQAVLWMKERGADYGVDPERVVLVGGSAGGHLALLAAYTAGNPAFPLASDGADTSVRGVVAFYPPVDFLALYGDLDRARRVTGRLDESAERALDRLFRLDAGDLEEELHARDLFPTILGGEPDEVPDAYRDLSPASHAGPHCPPTLLLQGSDDIFRLGRTVHRLHETLRQAGATSILVEFPHTEHAFDLVFPRISPAAQAATYDVERFLALLV